MENLEFPEVTYREAMKTKLNYFTCPVPCGQCGDARMFREKCEYLCYNCHKLKNLTPTDIRSAENQHNEKVRKTFKKNWSIPVVFSGMNTV